MSRHRWLPWSLGVLVLAGATTACSSDTRPASVVTDDGVTFVVRTEAGSGMEAQFAGTLEADGAGCLGIASTDGSFSTAVWPRGTTFDDGVLRVPGGAEVAIGEPLEGVGGEVGDDAPQLEELPEACARPVVLLSTVTR